MWAILFRLKTYYRQYNIGKGETKSIKFFSTNGFDFDQIRNVFLNAEIRIVIDDKLGKVSSPQSKTISEIATYPCNVK